MDKSEQNKIAVPDRMVVRFKPAKELKATAAKLQVIPEIAATTAKLKAIPEATKETAGLA